MSARLQGKKCHKKVKFPLAMAFIPNFSFHLGKILREKNEALLIDSFPLDRAIFACLVGEFCLLYENHPATGKTSHFRKAIHKFGNFSRDQLAYAAIGYKHFASDLALSAHATSIADAMADKLRPKYGCFCERYSDSDPGSSGNRLANKDHVCIHLFRDHGFIDIKQVDDALLKCESSFRELMLKSASERLCTASLPRMSTMCHMMTW